MRRALLVRTEGGDVHCNSSGEGAGGVHIVGGDCWCLRGWGSGACPCNCLARGLRSAVGLLAAGPVIAAVVVVALAAALPRGWRAVVTTV